ncbi:hypothetical protein [Streptosporangium sp. NPDC001681]|uniref:hypothetical protein n=1 Tax=Streptosporangium sp. NPDC001681 TaxID=3154395 RepID=UPI00332B60C3
MIAPSDESEALPPSKSDDFWTGWWTFIGGPALVIFGADDLIYAKGWWDYLSGIGSILFGAIMWKQHAKIIYLHIKKSRRNKG